MTTRSDQERLQDYLDDRMGPEERAAWEARIDREPALAEALEHAKRIRSALRADPAPELDEAFYTRARQRFAAEQRAHPPRGTHLLSWETMGLAAAAALALALFAPWLTDRGPDRLFSPESSGLARSKGEVESKGSLRSDDDAFADSSSELDLAEKARDETLRKARTQERVPLAPPGEGSRAEPVFGSDTDARSGSDAGALSNREVRKSSTGRRPADPDQQDASKAKRTRETAAIELEEAAPAPAPAAAARDRIISGAWRSPAVVELPADAAVENELVVLEDPVMWRTLREGPAGEALALLASPRADLRLVLVGPVTGVDCASVRVEREAELYRIVLGPGRPSAGGCALTLPRDSRPIVVDSSDRSAQ